MTEVIRPTGHVRGKRAFTTTSGTQLDGVGFDDVPDFRWESDRWGTSGRGASDGHLKNRKTGEDR